MTNIKSSELLDVDVIPVTRTNSPESKAIKERIIVKRFEIVWLPKIALISIGKAPKIMIKCTNTRKILPSPLMVPEFVLEAAISNIRTLHDPIIKTVNSEDLM